MTPDLKVTIAGVEFANPIMTASGCCGYGEELAGLYPLSKIGAIVTKSITWKPRLGHPVPRTAETASGMLNAIGLANVGVDAFIAEKFPFLEKHNTKSNCQCRRRESAGIRRHLRTSQRSATGRYDRTEYLLPQCR